MKTVFILSLIFLLLLFDYREAHIMLVKYKVQKNPKCIIMNYNGGIIHYDGGIIFYDGDMNFEGDIIEL